MRTTTLTLIIALAGFMPAADQTYAQSSGSGQTQGGQPGSVNQGGGSSGGGSAGGSAGGSGGSSGQGGGSAGGSGGSSGQSQGGQPATGGSGGSGQAGAGGDGSGQVGAGQPGGGGDQGGGQATANLIDATNPDALVSIMRDLGYRTTLETDKAGDPMIVSKVAGVNTNIFFYRCTDHKACKLIQFSTAFNTGGKGSPAKMAEWNKGHMLGVASLDGDFDPVIQMTVNMHGGISHDNFKDTVDWWDVVLTEFKEHIDF